MKKLMCGLGLGFIFCFVLRPSLSAQAALYDRYEQKAAATYGNLKIVSFSEQYDETRIHEIYEELLNNFHSAEFDALGAIYLYPDSPEGVAGNYYEDMRLDAQGNYTLGSGSYIELFNMDRKTPAEIAPVLAHEYGHHYTISNITVYENKYYLDWADTAYGRLRSLVDYPVAYDFSQADYTRYWDITEIAAYDYVQLLGSKNARESFPYQDAEQRLAADDPYAYSPTYYNMRPQENYDLPLATDTDGLLAYLLGVGGYTGGLPELSKKPEITAIMPEASFLNEKYTIYWDEAIGEPGQRFEYTAVMYPADFPRLATGIKTVADGGEMRAVIGSLIKQNNDGTVSAIMDYYVGGYIFRIYAKDENGYIFASDSFYYDFGYDYFDTAAYFENAAAISHEDESIAETAMLSERETPVAAEDKTADLSANSAPEEPGEYPVEPIVDPIKEEPPGAKDNARDMDSIYWRAAEDSRDRRRFRGKAVRFAKNSLSASAYRISTPAKRMISIKKI